VFSPDGRWLVTGGQVEKIRAFETGTGKDVPSFHEGFAAFAFHPDSKRLITAGHDHLPTLWDMATGKKLVTLAGPATQTESLALSPDGHELLVSTPEGQVGLWNLSQEKAAVTLIPVQTNLIASHSQFSPDGRRVLVATRDRLRGTAQVKAWDLDNHHEIAVLTVTNPIEQAVFSEDGRQLLTLAGSHAPTLTNWEVRVWDIRTGEVTSQFSRSYPLHLAANGKYILGEENPLRLLARSGEPKLHLWEVSAGRKVASCVAGGGFAAVSADGRHVLASSGILGRNQYVADIGTNGIMHVSEAHRARFTMLLSADPVWVNGTYLAEPSLRRRARVRRRLRLSRSRNLLRGILRCGYFLR
jgi:WD40 repeat protein